MKASGRRLRIGISACYFHSDPVRPIFKGKTLLYVEQSLIHWVLTRGAMAYMIPSVPLNGPLSLGEYVGELDGLVLHGGSDVAPESYGETALRPEWKGDLIRDRYEIELLRGFQAQRKPVLGICRGAQLMNVAFGGTLIQDIALQIPGAGNHRNWELYDQNHHAIRFEEGSELARIFAGAPGAISGRAQVNSIHHQGLKELGKGLWVEARSEPDGVIEAIRWDGAPFIYAVQWHPEFQDTEKNPALLDCTPLLERFLDEARIRRTP